MTNDNQNSKPKIVRMADAADMINQLRTVIDVTDDSKYTVDELRDLMIENNKHIAEKNGIVALSTKQIYEALTENELKKLVEEEVLVPSVSHSKTYYKI
ncbi:hypothetical protein [Sporosarcina sp. G11-34]|uniref:hypothetical protein n=1 Tax=Sporosarcina sp. G11-34 TaxID=2849605 RepID=UPI0022A8D985|nr:hypothetical protein [Sporosarcina sp. G11-34]MCZ2259423.1 hypothetical protein [Sporosarcina sp. G11-34]